MTQEIRIYRHYERPRTTSMFEGPNPLRTTKLDSDSYKIKSDGYLHQIHPKDKEVHEFQSQRILEDELYCVVTRDLVRLYPQEKNWGDKFGSLYRIFIPGQEDPLKVAQNELSGSFDRRSESPDCDINLAEHIGLFAEHGINIMILIS